MAKKKRKPSLQDLVCENCGGIEIEHQCWVDFYTDEVRDDIGDGDSSYNWCRICEDHFDFITLKEFKKKC